jgi:hypothetical protein
VREDEITRRQRRSEEGKEEEEGEKEKRHKIQGERRDGRKAKRIISMRILS